MKWILITFGLFAWGAPPGPSASRPAENPGAYAPAKKYTCEEFDLRRPGYSMADEPVHDQGNIGDCYSNAACTIADAWLHSNTPVSDKQHKLVISPIVSAINAKAASPVVIKKVRSLLLSDQGAPEGSLLSGGHVAQATRQIKASGSCSYDAVDGQLHNSSNEHDKSGWVNQISDIYAHYHDQLEQASQIVDDKTRDSKENRIINLAIKDYEAALRLGGFDDKTGLSRHDTISLIIRQSNVYDANVLVSNNLCPKSSHIDMPAEFATSLGTFNVANIQNENFRKSAAARSAIIENSIAAMLNFQNRQPIAIGYCDEALKDPTSPGYGISENGRTASKCSAHASVIVARKRTSTGCEYVIRNSWGDHDRSELGGIDAENLDPNGDVHVPVENLDRNIIEMTFIPPKGSVYTPPPDPYAGADMAYNEELQSKIYQQVPKTLENPNRTNAPQGDEPRPNRSGQ